MTTGSCEQAHRADQHLTPADPSARTEEASLDEAPDAYARFDAREDGYSKVVLKPGQAA